MHNRISRTDEVELREVCMRCLVKQETTDEASGNPPAPCPDCKGTGKITKWVSVDDFAEYIHEDMARKMRLQGYGRR